MTVRFAALAVCLAGCWRNADYISLTPGKFTTDPLNTPDDLRGIELTLDLDANRGEIRDGAASYTFTLTRHADRETWIDGCGTHSSYSKLEVADLFPHTFQLRGRTFSFKSVRAECAHRPGVWLWTDYHHAERLIFTK
jgi:hypothetical protein